jgi:hypothetical protein
MMIGFPVSINGETHRKDNGIGYHSTIKFFNTSKDHPHQVHQLAQNLPLNPPDPKSTQIEPGELKDRNGNTVYVLKLKGNHAEKIKEHNAKFSHMGDPQSYVYEPHISVPKDIHDKIKSSGAKTAHEAGIQFHPAELKRGPKTLATYHHEPDSAEPKFPDLGDMTAKMNVSSGQTKKSEHNHKLDPLMKPYVSEAQRRWAHTSSGKKALGGNAGVHEWDEATKGKKLPEKVLEKVWEPADPKKPGVSEVGKEVRRVHALSTPGSKERNRGLNIMSQEHAENVSRAPNAMHASPHKRLEAYIEGTKAQTRQVYRDNKKPSKGPSIPEPAIQGDTEKTKILAASEKEIKSLIKKEHKFHKHGKALALTGDTLKKYIEDNKDLQSYLNRK